MPEINFAMVAEDSTTLIFNKQGNQTVIKYATHKLDHVFKHNFQGPYTLKELKAAQDPKDWPEE